MFSQRTSMLKANGLVSRRASPLAVRATAARAGTATADVSSPSKSKTAKVCIVGAGPAGVLAAAAFAKRGMDVQVFEQRDQESVLSATSRTYAIIVTPRGVHAFQELGIIPSVIDPKSVQLTSLIRQRKEVPTGRALGFTKSSDAAYAMERQDLLASMLAAANQLPPDAGRISWHWGYKLANVDLTNRQATFEPADGGSGNQEKLQYDLLVGTDGAGSGVRGALEKTVPGFQTKLVYKSSVTWYKTFAGVDISELQNDDPSLPGLATLPPMGSFANISCKLYEAGKLAPIFNCWKGLDGKLAGSLALCPRFDLEFLNEQLSAALPGTPQAIKDRIVAQLQDDRRPASNSNTVLQVSQMHGPHCVILGDAAHPVTATLGQGCNGALESVMVLLQTWDRVRDMEKLPAAFNAARLHDVHALQAVDRMQLMAARPSDFPHASPLMLMSAKAVIRTSSALQTWLHNNIPSRFHHINPLFRVVDETFSYSQVLRLLLLQSGVVVGTALAPVALLLAWGAYVVAA